jgi:mono/diheme cytochrome c family protein
MLFLKARSPRTLTLLGSVLVAGALLNFGAANAALAQEKVIKKAPVQQSDPSSGKAMYASYCAACHGASGKGDGPAASEFKAPPTDLTQLAKNNRGTFPSDHLYTVLQHGAKTPAHGSSDMPVWGQLFGSLEPSAPTDQLKVNQRIHNLVDYLKTLQVK